MHLLVKAPALEAILPALRKAVAGFPNDRRLSTAVDVDPQSLL
jgi:hypothetical protein